MCRLFSALFMLMSSLALAQPAIDRYQFFRLGDAGEYLGLDASGAEPGQAGVGVVWDFSNLNRKADEDFTLRFDRSDAGPNADAYPGTDFVSIRVEGNSTAIDYLDERGNRLFVLGTEVSDVGVFRYSNVSFIANLLVGFGQFNTDPIGGSYVFTSIVGPSGNSSLSGTSTITYDGFGTLILPDGQQVDDILRVVFEREWDEDSVIGGTQVQTYQKETRYHYLEVGSSLPLFELIMTEQAVTPNGGITTTRLTKAAGYRVSATSKPELTARRGAHLTPPGGVFDSQLIVHNATELPQALNLQPLDEGGNLLAAATVDVASRTTSRQAAAAGLGEGARSLYATGCSSCTFSVGYRANIEGGSTAQVHQTRDFRKEFTFYPGEWDLLFDGQSVINVSDRAATLTATQVDFAGNVLGTITLETDLAAGGKHLSLLNDQFTNEPNSLIKLRSDERMGVMVLRISSDFRFLYQNNPLPAFVDTASGRWLPHLTSDSGGFLSEILVHNRADQQETLMLQPYEASGQALPQVPLVVAAGETRRLAKTDLFTAATTHASVSGSANTVVSVGYRAQAPSASTAVIHESAPVGPSFRIFPGEWDLLFDGLALVNTGIAPATISMSQVSDDGMSVTKVALVADLAPNAKFLGLLEGRVPENPESIIQIDSDQPLAVLSLRLSKDNLYLYNNEILPQ